jgi:hypothetical protein
VSFRQYDSAASSGINSLSQVLLDWEISLAIRSFDVGGLRGLRRAEAQELPNLCAISGPNGAGKSSLLELLKQRKNQIFEPGTELMYVGPHRTWRSGQVNEVAVFGMPMEFGAILMQDNMPGLPYPIANFQNFAGLMRHGSGGDDAQAYVKASIIRIRNKQQQILRREWQAQGGKVTEGSVPDLFEMVFVFANGWLRLMQLLLHR